MGATKRDLDNFNESEIIRNKKTDLSSVLNFIQNIIDDVDNGNREALDVFITFKSISEALDKGKKLIDDKAIKEASKYQNDTYNGFKLSIVNGRKMYSFKDIPEIETKQKEIKELETKYKSALNGVQKGIVQVQGEHWIDENGELLPFPTISFGKDYIKIEKEK